MKYSSAFWTVAACAVLLCITPVAAEDFTSNSGKVYKNYRVLKITEQGMMISHSEGVAYLIYSDLPEEVAGAHSPDLKLRSGRVLKKYSISEVGYKSFKIKHDSATEQVPFGELPAWLLKRHKAEVEKAQALFIDEAIRKIPKHWDFDEAFAFFKKNAVPLSGHPKFGELKGALADFAVVMIRKSEDFEDAAAICEMVLRGIPGHPKVETVKNAFADYAIGKIRKSLEIDAIPEGMLSAAEQKAAREAAWGKERETLMKENVEFEIPGLLFFAELKKNFNAVECLPSSTLARRIGRSVHPPKFTVFDHVKAVRFQGDPLQGVLFRYAPPALNSPRTVCVWFCSTGLNRHDGSNSILSYGSRNPKCYFDFETDRSGAVRCAWDAAESPLVPAVRQKQWHHLAVTYDGKVRRAYLDGAERSSLRVSLKTEPTELMIGTRIGDRKHCFVGYVRNAAVYDRSLEAAEIKKIAAQNLRNATPEEEAQAAKLEAGEKKPAEKGN